ncbi:MAG TPA: hypothetical protein VFV47_03195 [Hyphomicrobiaceae bacterium]|jgi:hypothetical protein|nr:hypothetical protein [Hyphomicrobiaceae bacterium]
MKRSEFLLNVGHSLAACQLLEFELKLYIERAFEVARKKTSGVVHFGFSGSDYEDSSLEKLISVFRKLTNNRELCRKLDEFRKDRNFVAHKAIAACVDPEGGLDESKVAEVQVLLSRVSQEARSLSDQILEESKCFFGHHYIDEEPNQSAQPTPAR